MIIVTGYVDVAPFDVDEFRIDIERLMSSARAREGCLFYAVAPENVSIGRMLVSERWTDPGALTAHLEASDTAAFIRKWTGRMTGAVRKFDATNERELADE